MVKKRYRNAIRSKKLIREAFLELLREQPFEKITVTAIVKKADVNRSTFYEHYPDIMGIIDEIEEEIIEYTITFMEKIGICDFWKNPEVYIEFITKILEDNRELFALLSNSKIMGTELEKIKDILLKRILVTMKQKDNYDVSEDDEFYICFMLGGVVEISMKWLLGKIDYTLDEIREKITKLIVVMEKING